MAQIGIEGFSTARTALKVGQTVSATATQGTDIYTQHKTLIFGNVGTGFTMPLKTVSTDTPLIISMGWRPASFQDICWVSGDAGGTRHLTLNISNIGTLELYRGTTAGTLLASSVNPLFTLNNRHHIEFKCTIADAGGTCIVRVDGVEVINFTGDTRNGGTNTWLDQLGIGDNATIDSVVWRNTAGAAPYNDFMGDQLVLTLLPNGDGASSQFLGSDGNSVNNSLLVDELPVNTTDYVGSSTVGQRDLYAFEDLIPAGTVHAVQVNAYVTKTDAGARNFKHLNRSGGGTVNAGANAALTTSYAIVTSALLITDADGTGWTPAKVNAEQFGIECA